MHESISKATLGHLFNVIHDLFCALDNFPTMCSPIVLPADAFPHRNSHSMETVASVLLHRGCLILHHWGKQEL